MNPMTQMLAGLMGPVLLLLGVGMLLNRAYYASLFKDVCKPSMGTMLTSMLMILAGSVLVQSHWFWTSVPEVLVSIVGLGILIKGAAFALLPHAFDHLVQKIVSTPLVLVGAVIWTVGGAYLTWIAYL